MAKPNHGNQQPTKTFRLKFCEVSFFDSWAWTQFDDGEGWGAVPGDDPSYRRLARNLGYGTDIVTYCLEHDFLHNFLEGKLFKRPSPILWSLAHGLSHPWTTVYEEALVQAFQGFLRASDEHGQYDMTATAPDVDWCQIREEVYGLLGRWQQDVRQGGYSSSSATSPQPTPNAKINTSIPGTEPSNTATIREQSSTPAIKRARSKRSTTVRRES